MALIKCSECGNEVSDKAKACTNCGAKPRFKFKFLGYTGGFFVLLFSLLIVVGVFSDKRSSQSTPEPPPVNFDMPLETEIFALTCPTSVSLDNREDRGLQAAMDAHLEMVDHQKDVEKAGCSEWREGIPIQLSDEEKQQAKKWQAKHSCGMLSFDAGYIFSCSLRNQPGNNTKAQSVGPTNRSGTVRLKWDAPATLSGTLESGVFDNCCINGEETRQAYSFLRLDSKVDIEPKDEDEQGMENVEVIQIGGTLQNFRDGQHVVVNCKQVWSGNTGHYALPVYCTEPTATIVQSNGGETKKNTQHDTDMATLELGEAEIQEAMNDPEKVKIMECMGVQVYQDPQPAGHPASPEECARLEKEMQLQGGGPNFTFSRTNTKELEEKGRQEP